MILFHNYRQKENIRTTTGGFMIKSRITIMDVAQQAGVSKGAVSLALNNSPAISPETTARIRKIASWSLVQALRWRK